MPSSWAADRDDFVGLNDGGRIRHQPGLDGLRGLAVAAVVVFHTGLGWLPGGYLGVSLFFTLSGVVIGTVHHPRAAADRHASRCARFWSRRARRLLPAAWVVLAAVAVGRVVTSTCSRRRRRGDVVASWLHVANWHFLLRARLLPRPLQRPVGAAALLEPGDRGAVLPRRRARAIVLARGARRGRPATSASSPSSSPSCRSPCPSCSRSSVDRTYYGTDTRAGELLVGLVLAAVIADRGRRRERLRGAGPAGRRRARRPRRA